MRKCIVIFILMAGVSAMLAPRCSACIVLGDTALAPEIHIVGLDSGATVIQGTANNVCRDSVWVVLWALTNHWYVQPLCTDPFDSVDANGNWSNWTHGWTRIVALLVNRTTYVVPASCQHWDHPSMDPGVLAWDGGVPEPTLSFRGYTWIKKHGGQRDPGNNFWSDYGVWVDQDGLHLRTSYADGHWYCAEVLLDHSLGYGTYTYQLTSRVDSLDDNTIFAGFTYESDTQEIDIEFSRALMPPPNNAQYVVQPWDNPGNLHRFIMPPVVFSSHRFIWTVDTIWFVSWEGLDASPDSTNLIESWTYTGDDIPPPGNERMRFNLWLHNGQPPQYGDEVVVRSFQHEPIHALPVTDLTVYLTGDDILLNWTMTDAEEYHIYDSSDPETFGGAPVIVTAPPYLFVGHAAAFEKRFYRVIAVKN